MTEASIPIDSWGTPIDDCDIVMKGGITSGVVYPKAITTFARIYRFHGVGGASAGAIGAAFAAAAEHGRFAGGFTQLDAIPEQLKGRGLIRLFQPHPSLLGLFWALRGLTERKSNPLFTVLFRAFALLFALLPAMLFAIPGIWAIVVRDASDPNAGLQLASAIALLVAGVLVGLLVCLGVWLLAFFPRNNYGICPGIAVGRGDEPGPDASDAEWKRYRDRDGLTDWLARNIDEMAGIGAERPLTFAHLKRRDEQRDHEIDLRMVASCLNRARPYEFPQEQRFYFEKSAWQKLFPAYVVAALETAAATERLSKQKRDLAAEHDLLPLPTSDRLPVIVAVRMSLSFPLLFSAIPLWVIEEETSAVYKPSKANKEKAPFRQLWFMDGGLCSNFPLNLFEKTLPTRPTFGINLGRFDDDTAATNEPVLLATSNSNGTRPSYRNMPDSGIGAVIQYAVSLVDTMRNWQDNSYLTMPGYRDRIARVQQTKREGGLNLKMDDASIDSLSSKGEKAATALIEQFRGVTYRPAPKGKSAGAFTGWDNHRWIRFRAALAVLPDYLDSYRNGREALGLADPEAERSAYPFVDVTPGFQVDSVPKKAYVYKLDKAVRAAAKVVADDRERAEQLAEEPKPKGRLRRVSTF